MRRTVAMIAAFLAIACQDAPRSTGPDELPALLAGDQRAGTALATTAEVEFGSDEVGSPFPPAEHDNSFHSFDRLRPVTVTIARGGSVTFEVYPCHQPAVYEAGTAPEDIDASLLEPIGIAGCPPDRIDDPSGRLALAPPQSDEEHEWTTPPGTFDQPGRYLVICTTFVHFAFAKMYGWVIVQ
jgi:plastocyanin